MKRAPQFTNIRTEGGLLPADLLVRVALLDTDLDAVSAEDYHLAAGERITEAIDRSWNRLVGAWEVFAQTIGSLTADDRTATEPTRRRWSLVLFQELGYGQLQVAKAAEVAGKSYPISHAWGAVSVHLVGARVELDHRTPGVAGASTMSPHGLVQEFLNRSDEHLWGFVSNGLRLRLLRDNAALTRQAFVEFDLEAIFTGQAYADFVVLWLLCHESRLEGEPPEKCVLERWMADAAQQGTRALDQLRIGVESAITALGEGFLVHKDNRDLRERLRAGELSTQDYYRQLLRLVYRVIFLSVAEDRDLLLDPAADPTARERYLRFYALARVRRLAETRRGGAHPDIWSGLHVVFGGLGSSSGLAELALPSLGSFLWSDRACPELDSCSLSNRHLLSAVRALTSVRDGNVLRSVDYRNLGSEELGSIYESLLELHPQLSVDAGLFSLATAAGNERKTTGSYYTPTSLITELLNSALDPVLDEAVGADNPEEAILGLTVLDPACGSGHFLIAAAHRIAKRLAAVRTGDNEPSPLELRRALRDVISRCLHGIDMNEMAVELCKVSLWMEAMEPGKPLSFLDHRIARGNSLLGTTPRLLAGGVPDEAFKPLKGDEKAIVTTLRKRNKQEREGQGALLFGPSGRELLPAIAAEMEAIAAMPEDTMLEVQDKERRWLLLQRSSELGRAELAADSWCAAFVCHKVRGAPVITDAFVRQAAAHDPSELDSATVEEVTRLRRHYGFLHLHLAFPEIFRLPATDRAENELAGWDGGFDVVLGNPPWERVKLQEKEWFASRVPEIAASTSASERKRLIAELAETAPELHQEYLDAIRQADGESHFLRSSRRFPLCGRGDVNTYAVFAEAMRAAMTRHGRAGVIVPSGIATDDLTKHFFADIVANRSLVSLYDFENKRRVFPAVDSRVKFCLLTLTGALRPIKEPEFVFFAYSPADLREQDRGFSLSAEDLALLNPNTNTCPVFRSRRDAAISKAIYRRIPVLLREGQPDANPWGIDIRRIFDMGKASTLTLCSRVPEAEHPQLPMYESKLIHQHNHRFASYEADRSPVNLTTDQLTDPEQMVTPRFWIRSEAVRDALQESTPHDWLLAWRDICRSTDERTMIAAVLPAAGTDYTIRVGFSSQPVPLIACLAASFDSFPFDWCCRQMLGGSHLSDYIVRQLPVLPPSIYQQEAKWSGDETLAAWIVPRALELIYTAWDMQQFALDVGYEGRPFRWHAGRREQLRAELDACFFHCYGIERQDSAYMMDAFPIVRRKDEAAHGEYRTKRLVLEIYDAMAKARDAGEPYQTSLDPPPADARISHPAK